MNARRRAAISRAGIVLAAIAGAVVRAPATAHAYMHVVRRGETLASIAQSAYGRADLEYVLVGANALDVEGGSAIAPGLRLEIPALEYRRAAMGDTWGGLADRYLGEPNHATILAEANDTHPWLLPEPGAVFAVPYVLRHFAAAEETVFDLAARYYGDKLAAWRLVVFNDLKGNDVHRGDVVLVPLTSLALTPAGEAEAAAAIAPGTWTSAGAALRARQRAIDAGIADLAALVDGARYLEAVALAHALYGLGRDSSVGEPSGRGVATSSTLATRSQRSRIAKLLTEAYVALDAPGPAADACKIYLDDANVVHLEIPSTSPKIRAACERAKGLVNPK